ncbi:MAG: hypothetical protein LBC44_00695 [Mycoplasmataceae bacterium]|nr:hypothetical protein [Mycoplasmataceae bacterium]
MERETMWITDETPPSVKFLETFISNTVSSLAQYGKTKRYYMVYGFVNKISAEEEITIVSIECTDKINRVLNNLTRIKKYFRLNFIGKLEIFLKNVKFDSQLANLQINQLVGFHGWIYKNRMRCEEMEIFEEKGEE